MQFHHHQTDAVIKKKILKFEKWHRGAVVSGSHTSVWAPSQILSSGMWGQVSTTSHIGVLSFADMPAGLGSVMQFVRACAWMKESTVIQNNRVSRRILEFCSTQLHRVVYCCKLKAAPPPRTQQTSQHFTWSSSNVNCYNIINLQMRSFSFLSLLMLVALAEIANAVPQSHLHQADSTYGHLYHWFKKNKTLLPK